MRLSLRVLALALAAISAVTCTESPPTVPASTLPGRLAIAPSFSTEAAAAYRSLAAFGLDVTNVHVRLTGPDGAATETTVQFGASDTLRIEIPVPASKVDQLFTALIELRNASNVVLFSGTQQVIARGTGSPDGAAPPVALQYTGPGRDTRTITISPRDSAVAGVTTLAIAAVGTDAAGKVIPDLLVRWTSSDTTLATVTASGDAAASVHTFGKRGVVSLTALTPLGVAGTARLTVGPAASRIVLVGGGGQTGLAGRALAQPMVVEVQAADNVAVAGAPVSFRAVTAGGSVSVASAVTDASGRASTVLIVGRTAGSYSFEAASGTLALVAVTAIATPAPASALSIVSGNTQSDSTNVSLTAPLVVRASDEFGAPVAGATIDWTRIAGSGKVGTPTTVTGSDGVARTTYTLGITPGQDSIRADLRGPSGTSIGSVTFSARTVSRGARDVTIVSGAGQVGLVGASLPNPLVVRAVDSLGNGVVGASVNFSGTGMSFAPARTVSGAGGIAQATITMGATVGTYTGTVSVANASRSFTEVARTLTNTFQVLQLLPDTIYAGIQIYTPLAVRMLDPNGVALRTSGVTVTATAVVTPVDSGTSGFATATDTGGVARLYLPPYNGPLGTMTITISAAGTTPLVLPPITIAPYPVGNRIPQPATGAVKPASGTASSAATRRAGARSAPRESRPQ